MIPKEEDGKGRWVDRQNRRGEREIKDLLQAT